MTNKDTGIAGEHTPGMRSRTARVGTLFLILPLALSLVACDIVDDGIRGMDNVQIGVVENTGLNSTEASFHTLRGRKVWRERLDVGATLALHYEVQVEKGTLILQVENPEDEVVWERTLEKGVNAGDSVEIAAEEGGTFTIAVVGDDAGGSYELSWEEVK